MYSAARLAAKYLQYYLTASNGKGHGVHSPFVFEFIHKVLADSHEYDCYATIEMLREELKKNLTTVEIEDLGAGSRVSATHKRRISAVASSALKPKKFGQLLFRMTRFYMPAQILELGTSLGITTAYLASGNPQGIVTTMEGAQTIAAIAKENFRRLQLANIHQVEGNFDTTLTDVLEHLPTVDLAFVDGNHRKEPTVRYFLQLLPRIQNDSILIFDDIHWSEDMEAAWEFIKAHESVTLSIDLFFIGLVFFRSEQKIKQHFTIRF